MTYVCILTKIKLSFLHYSYDTIFFFIPLFSAGCDLNTSNYCHSTAIDYWLEFKKCNSQQINHCHDIIKILLEGGCSIEGYRHLYKIGEPMMMKEDKFVRYALFKDLSKNYIDHIDTIRKMQLQGYHLSKGEKDLIASSMSKADKALDDDLDEDEDLPLLDKEKTIRKALDIQQPLSLLAQSRIQIRRKIMATGKNIYRSLKELGLAQLFIDMISCSNSYEIQSCLRSLGTFGLKVKHQPVRVARSTIDVWDPREEFFCIKWIVNEDNDSRRRRGPIVEDCLLFVGRVTRLVEVWKV